MDHIIEETTGGVVILIINIDRATLREAEPLKDKIAKNLEEGFTKYIIDISACEFIDSTFLGVLVNTLKKVAKLNGDLKLVGFKPAVRSMFELTRMFRVFETYSELKEAVKSYGS